VFNLSDFSGAQALQSDLFLLESYTLLGLSWVAGTVFSCGAMLDKPPFLAVKGRNEEAGIHRLAEQNIRNSSLSTDRKHVIVHQNHYHRPSHLASNCTHSIGQRLFQQQTSPIS
jgi:hypothetical protein